MEFIKGTILGMMAGAVVGAMNSDFLYDTFKNGKKEFKKIKRKFSF